MTLTKYRTTKLPEHYFNEIESFIAESDKYVSVSEFLRNAVDEKLSSEKNDRSFLVAKDMVFTKTRLLDIHRAIAEITAVEQINLLRIEFTSVIEESLDLNIYRFLAKFMYNFMKFHPFHDGNKRTALVAVDVFLRLNRRRLVLKVKDARFIWQASIQQKTVSEIEKFLKKHTKHYLGSVDFDKELKKCLKEKMNVLENLSQ